MKEKEHYIRRITMVTEEEENVIILGGIGRAFAFLSCHFFYNNIIVYR